VAVLVMPGRGDENITIINRERLPGGGEGDT
jgi:hypothetical protein